MPSPKLSTTRTKSASIVRCDECDQINPTATRGRARQHAVNTGHVVRFAIEDVTTYRIEPTE